MRFNDALIGILAIILGIIVFIHVRSFPVQADGHAGPGLFPSVLAVLLVIVGGLLIRQGLRSGSPLFERLPELDARGLGNIMLTLGSIVFYVLVSEKLGFLLSSFIVMVAMMLMLKAKPLTAAPVAAATTLFIYGIFNKFLLVPLPRGIFYF